MITFFRYKGFYTGLYPMTFCFFPSHKYLYIQSSNLVMLIYWISEKYIIVVLFDLLDDRVSALTYW